MAKNNFEVGFIFGAKKAATFDSAVKGVIKGIAGIASAYVGINTIKDAIDTFATFEEKMAGVQAVSGATAEEFKAMEAAALSLKNATPEEGAEALDNMAAAGWNVQDSIKGLEPMINLAKAGNFDLATASNLATNSMAVMGIEVDNMAMYLDKATKAGAASNASTQDMLEAYTRVGGVFKNLNTPLEESGALLGVLANRGTIGVEAGTSLNAVMARMTNTAGPAAKAFKELGIKAYDSEGNFRGFEAVFDETRIALSGLTEAEQQYYKSQIAGNGAGAAKAFNDILAGMGDEYHTLKEEIGDADGAMADMAATMTNTYKGAMARMGAATDKLKIQFVKVFETEMTGAINWVAEAIPVATDKIIGGIQSIKDKAAPVFATVKSAGATAIQYVKSKWDQYGPGIIAFLVSAKDQAISTFRWAKDTAIDAFSNIQSKVVELKPKFVNIGRAIKDVGTKIYTALKLGFEKAKPVINWVAVTGLPLVIGALTDTVSFAADVYHCFSDNWSTIEPIVVGIGIAFAAWKVPGILATCIEGIANFGGLLVALPAKIAAATTAQLALVKAKVADKIETLQLCGLYAKDFVVSLYSNVKAVAASTASWVANKAIMIGSKVAMLALKGAQIISTGATAAMTAAQWALNAAFVASPIGWIVLAIGALIAIGVLLYKNWDKIKVMAGKVWQGMKDAFGGAVAWFRGVWDGVTSTVQNFMAGLQEKFPMIADIISVPINAVKGYIDGLKQTFTGIIDFVAGVFTGDWTRAWEGVKGIFGGIFQSFSSLAKTPINAVIAIINGAIRGINGISVDVPDWVPGLGGKTYGFSIPEIPMLAKGGIATGPTVAMVGEGSESEAILPLSKLGSMLNAPMGGIASLIDRFLAAIDQMGGGLPPIEFKPQLVFNGPANAEDVQQGLRLSFVEFKKLMAQYEQDRIRKSLK